MPYPEQPFGNGHRLNEAANEIRRKVHRALERGTGCRLSAIEVEALNCIEGDGDWWKAGVSDRD